MVVPKQRKKLTEKEQGEKFKKAVLELVDAGKLNPTEAGDALDRMLKNSARNA